MNRPLSLVAAVVLASALAGCTDSERPRRDAVANGAVGNSVVDEPFVPYSPSSPSSPSSPPVTAPFAGPSAGTGDGSLAPMPPTATCGGVAMPSGPTMAAPLPISLPDATASKPPRPISGGTLLVLRDGSAAVVSDPDRDLVSIVDLGTRTLRAQIPLSTGDEPGRLVEDGAGLVHVVLRSGGGLATIDPAAGTVVRRTGLCPAPRGLAYDASLDWLHVACADGALLSLDAATSTVRRRVALERDLRDVVALSDGRLLVSTFRHADAIVIGADGTVGERLHPSVHARKGFTGIQMMSAAVAWRLAPLPGGGALMLHQRGVDDAINAVPGGYTGGGALGCSSVVESAVTVVAPGQASSPTPALGLATLAVDLAVSPDGTQVAVASPGNAGTKLPQITITGVASATASASDCAMPNGSTSDGAPGQIVSLAYAATGGLLAQSREPAALVFVNGSSDTFRGQRVSLASDSLADTGHAVFHVNAGGGIACASCHPEGGDDGRVWNFACLGPRRTQSIRGGLSGTEPFHWEGDMPDFETLARTVFEGRMSGPPLAPTQSSALLRWIDSIPAMPNPTTATAAVGHGDALFHDAAVGCSTCHAGALLTNNKTVDVGLGLATQVPSLRGVVWRAPFLHTGCAKTLRDRFDPACGGGDRHGHTSQLSSTDLDDLVAYLETL